MTNDKFYPHFSYSMVFAAITQVTQGHLYITVIDALTAPDVRHWLRAPFSPDAEDNRVVHYTMPTMDIELSDVGPSNITWITGDLVLERHSQSSAMSMRPNQFHSTSDTFRVVCIIARDRPRYVVIGWNIPLEPIISLAEDGTDGSVSSLITAPANLLQIANFHAPVTRWMETYDSDSEAPSTPSPIRDDDSPPPPHLRVYDQGQGQHDTDDDQEGQDVPQEE